MECKLDECVIKKNFECCHGCDKEYSCERRCTWYSNEDCEHLVNQEKKCGLCAYESTITKFTAHYYDGESFECKKFKFCPKCGKEI